MAAPPLVFDGILKTTLPVSEPPANCSIMSSTIAGAVTLATIGIKRPTISSTFSKAYICFALPVERSTSCRPEPSCVIDVQKHLPVLGSTVADCTKKGIIPVAPTFSVLAVCLSNL